jgi:predicted RNase H-like HicB family nuclease
MSRERKVVLLPPRSEYHEYMKQFTAIFHRGEPEEGGFWATCLEVPGANGQGETKEECLRNLTEAIQLMLENEREEAFRLDPRAETAELLLA